MTIAPLLTLIASLIGFCISAYIYAKKKPKAKTPMTCPMGAHCGDVIGSKYGKTFGIENTFFGMLYYGGIGVYCLLVLQASSLLSMQILPLLIDVATTGAFLFSLYLIGIMKFRLKMWCTWCLASAACSTIIFFMTVFFL